MFWKLCPIFVSSNILICQMPRRWRRRSKRPSLPNSTAKKICLQSLSQRHVSRWDPCAKLDAIVNNGVLIVIFRCYVVLWTSTRNSSSKHEFSRFALCIGWISRRTTRSWDFSRLQCCNIADEVDQGTARKAMRMCFEIVACFCLKYPLSGVSVPCVGALLT